MERGDYGLILQAAVSGAFDFTDRHPARKLRLELVLRELIRLNNARDAENKAHHCAVASCHGDNESREENYSIMQKDNNIFRRMLGLPTDEDAEKTSQERLIETWRKWQKELNK